MLGIEPKAAGLGSKNGHHCYSVTPHFEPVCGKKQLKSNLTTMGFEQQLLFSDKILCCMIPMELPLTCCKNLAVVDANFVPQSSKCKCALEHGLALNLPTKDEFRATNDNQSCVALQKGKMQLKVHLSWYCIQKCIFPGLVNVTIFNSKMLLTLRHTSLCISCKIMTWLL